MPPVKALFAGEGCWGISSERLKNHVGRILFFLGLGLVARVTLVLGRVYPLQWCPPNNPNASYKKSEPQNVGPEDVKKIHDYPPGN